MNFQVVNLYTTHVYTVPCTQRNHRTRALSLYMCTGESLSYFRGVPFEENGNWEREREKGQDGCETGRKTKEDEYSTVYKKYSRHDRKRAGI